MLKYKLILAGSKNVGKSSLIARFCDNTFNDNMMDTIGVAFKRKRLNVDDKMTIDLNIWDFGGEEKYRALFPSYVNGAAGALILYDITRKETLDDVKNWIKIIDDNMEGVVKIIIGTKMDLEDQRQISKAVASKASQALKCCIAPIETSSKTGDNVEEAFLNVARKIMSEKVQTCSACGEMFNKLLKFCNHCGEKVELEVVQ